MFCEYCGAENPDDATFCRGCGKRLNAMQAKNEKNMITALIISFILPGLCLKNTGIIAGKCLRFSILSQ